MSAVPLKTCTRCRAAKPPAEFGVDVARADGRRYWCLVCDREYSRTRTRPRTTDRMLRSRAVNRAMARLRDLHRDEYERLLAEELDAARAEAAKHAETAPKPDDEHCAPPVPLLRPGPAAIGETGPRLREDVGTCPLCVNRHDRGHVCPACGARPQLLGRVVPPPRRGLRVEDVV